MLFLQKKALSLSNEQHDKKSIKVNPYPTKTKTQERKGHFFQNFYQTSNVLAT